MLFLHNCIALFAACQALYLPNSWRHSIPHPGLLIKVGSQNLDELNFEDWISEQSDRSFSYILENIGGISSVLDRKQVLPGVVIASPLKVDPDYFYTWTRDSALTVRTLIYHMNDYFRDDALVARLRKVVEDYIEVNYKIQRLPNQSGRFEDERRSGLGEPKFLTTAKSFDENWGRPQSDGPGLRVSTILGYLFFLERNDLQIENDFLGNTTFIYYHIIKPDLEYIVANWNEKLFDLWEEVNSHHFFTSLTQLKALQDGQRFARTNVIDMKFAEQLQTTYDLLKDFITSSGGFTKPSIPYVIEIPELHEQGTRSGLDAATFLAALHAHNLEFGGTDNIPFDVDDSHILNTITAMVADMRQRYPINHNKARWQNNVGVALGRYPEDVYDGQGTSLGNPWFISTLSASEILFKWIYKNTRRNADIVIDKLNIAFFRPHDAQLNDEAPISDSKIVIPYKSERYHALLTSIYKYADSFIASVQGHVHRTDGTMLEQFDRWTGYMRGAKLLTWLYLAFHNCARWRSKAADEIEWIRN